MSYRRDNATDIYDREGENPGAGLVVGLLVFLLVIGLIGWHTRPVHVAYTHTCRRYETEDDDDDDDWEEGYAEDDGNVKKIRVHGEEARDQVGGEGWQWAEIR